MSAPIPRYTLQPSESVVHVEPPSFNPEKTPAPKWKLFSLSASVLPEIMLYVFLLCLWSALVTCCFILWDFKGFAINPFIISILGVVIGLVLVFRTNTAYDRYWEARKLWSTLTSHLRNLSRIVIICSNNKAERHGVLNLIVAYAVSLKHHLRDEKGTRYQDLHNLLIHVPSFRPDRYQHPFTNLPIQISIYIGSWVRKAREASKIC
jgi:putative membrane protein